MYECECRTCGYKWEIKEIENDIKCVKCGSYEVDVWDEVYANDLLKVADNLKNKTPKHYDFKIQPLDVIDDWNLDFYRGNAVKYIARAGRKGSAIEDINKAIHYLELYKKRILNGGSKKEK